VLQWDLQIGLKRKVEKSLSDRVADPFKVRCHFNRKLLVETLGYDDN
jgi:hypothetical protein